MRYSIYMFSIQIDTKILEFVNPINDIKLSFFATHARL